MSELLLQFDFRKQLLSRRESKFVCYHLNECHLPIFEGKCLKLYKSYKKSAFFYPHSSSTPKMVQSKTPYITKIWGYGSLLCSQIRCQWYLWEFNSFLSYSQIVKLFLEEVEKDGIGWKSISFLGPAQDCIALDLDSSDQPCNWDTSNCLHRLVSSVSISSHVKQLATCPHSPRKLKLYPYQDSSWNPRWPHTFEAQPCH